MKIAISSSSFARVIAAGELTQLEWLDVCANELEADAVVFDAAQFPRTDDEYLAQLKKCAVDLGLAVAGVATDAFFDDDDGARWLAVAAALGSPLVLARAPHASDDPAAWGAFADRVKLRSRDAKRTNVTLALGNLARTLCASVADLRRVAKDVDSAWLRFALDPGSVGAGDDARGLLPKCVIVRATLVDPTTFATPGDRVASGLIEDLARFRGCVLLDGEIDPSANRRVLHDALGRFAHLRANALVARA